MPVYSAYAYLLIKIILFADSEKMGLIRKRSGINPGKRACGNSGNG
jgi:hypothetical protein